MQKTYIIVTFISLISILGFIAAPPQAQAQSPASDYPARLVIPSIALNNKIVQVGTNSKGEMAVPNGITKNVGWYKKGTVPGDVGSAVIDAHVFAAFSKLNKLGVGSDIYVQTAGNKLLHFVVSNVKTYALADLPPSLLFDRADTERLNLITCAGKLTADHSTYNKRLVVYATLVHNANYGFAYNS